MSESREIEVLVFAGLRARAARDRLTVQVPAPGTVAQLLVAVHRQYGLGPLQHCRVAVDHQFAEANTVIPDDVEVALIPPVSGGHDDLVGSRSMITARTLSLDVVVAAVRHEGAGGIATFTGCVRRRSRGQTVDHLEYEAYAPMAVHAMDAIATRLEAEAEGVRVRIHHRVGTLTVGEIAVVIAASAPHRAEAFTACRGAIEALKQDVPIWKKEVGTNGESWIGRGP